MYKKLPSLLAEIGKDDSIHSLLLTGSGSYYSSGNDLIDFVNRREKQKSTFDFAENSSRLLEDFVRAFIDFPKLLFASLNGPAIGIAATTLGLCDGVFASSSSWISTPFALLGQSPEGCSSYTFPKILGGPRANDLLLFGKKLSASELKDAGFLRTVHHPNDYKSQVEIQLKDLLCIPSSNLSAIKAVLRNQEKDTLYSVNEFECQCLAKAWQNPNVIKQLMNFLNRQQQLKASDKNKNKET